MEILKKVIYMSDLMEVDVIKYAKSTDSSLVSPEVSHAVSVEI